MNNLKFAFRQLLKNPGFTAVAVLTLALGIGANTAIFGVINELLLRPLPVKDPETLLGIVLTDRREGDFAGQSIPYPIVQDYREQTRGVPRGICLRPSPRSLTSWNTRSSFWTLKPSARQSHFSMACGRTSRFRFSSRSMSSVRRVRCPSTSVL